MITYPLNNILYSAEDAELFHCTRNSGVYAGDDFEISVSGANNTVVLQEGIAWIRNSKFSGKVVALKSPLSLDLGIADANYPRIDSIVIQFDANKNSTEIVVKKGTAATNPVAPSVVKTEAVYELHLYHIVRPAAATAVTSAQITDLRSNENYCGLMYDGVTEVGTAIEKAIEDALAEAKNSGEFDGEPGRGVDHIAYSGDGVWVISYSDNTQENINGPNIPDTSGLMPKTGGTFAGAVYAVSGASATAQLRNTSLVPTDTDPTVNGQINWTYS